MLPLKSVGTPVVFKSYVDVIYRHINGSKQNADIHLVQRENPLPEFENCAQKYRGYGSPLQRVEVRGTRTQLQAQKLRRA